MKQTPMVNALKSLSQQSSQSLSRQSSHELHRTGLYSQGTGLGQGMMPTELTEHRTVCRPLQGRIVALFRFLVNDFDFRSLANDRPGSL